MIKKYFELKYCTLVKREWRSSFKNLPAPNQNTIKSKIEQFDKTGSVESLPDSSQKREDAKSKLNSKICFRMTQAYRLLQGLVIGYGKKAF